MYDTFCLIEKWIKDRYSTALEILAEDTLAIYTKSYMFSHKQYPVIVRRKSSIYGFFYEIYYCKKLFDVSIVINIILTETQISNSIDHLEKTISL